MTDNPVNLIRIGDEVEHAVCAGDGNGVMRLMGQWMACIHKSMRSGKWTDVELNDILHDCIVRNQKWLAIAVEGQKQRAQELGRRAQIDRKQVLVRRMYQNNVPASEGHIVRRG